jgi:hypothetical protein
MCCPPKASKTLFCRCPIVSSLINKLRSNTLPMVFGSNSLNNSFRSPCPSHHSAKRYHIPLASMPQKTKIRWLEKCFFSLQTTTWPQLNHRWGRINNRKLRKLRRFPTTSSLTLTSLLTTHSTPLSSSRTQVKVLPVKGMGWRSQSTLHLQLTRNTNPRMWSNLILEIRPKYWLSSWP